MSDQILNINEYSIDDLKQLFSLNDDYTEDDINESVVELIKRYRSLGQGKNVIFLRKAKDKLMKFLNDEYTDNVNTDIGFDFSEEDMLYNKKDLIDRQRHVDINNQDNHFFYTRNRETIDQTHNIPVVQGQTNPVLRNINRRIISIDTQMRADINADPNNITLNLSEPLKNVLTIRLLTVEIRHCWYTFDEAYGTTDFLVDSTLVKIPNGNYSESDLITEINNKLGSEGLSDIEFSYNSNTGKVTITNNDISDHTIYFYDNEVPGNKKKNSNLGWLLGYRMLDVSNNINTTLGASGSGTNTSTGNSLLDVYGTKYILLELEDYNNNNFNRSFVAVNDDADTLAYPSYYTPDLSFSDPLYRGICNEENTIIWVESGLTQSQAFTITEISSSRERNKNNKVSALQKNNIFAKLPIKYTKQFDTLIYENNVTTKNVRLYFGPVNIGRVKIAVYNDAGQLLNLNGQDFSLTLQCEELYQY